MTYVIVGGVAGGASAAARLRRLDESAEIIVIERGNYVSFANCGLPYHIGGVIEDRNSLLVQTQEGLSQAMNLDIRVLQEAVSLDTLKKQLTVRDRKSGRQYKQSYDKLLLSPGADPIKPPIPGIDSPRILTLRSMEDMDRIIDSIERFGVSRAAVVGAGFIGVEIAENFRHRGIEVSVVEKLNQVLAPVDYEIASQVHQHMAEHGVSLYLSNGVKEFTDDEDSISVHLEDGCILHADLVVLSIGVSPETSLARAAGIETGSTGGIKVDETLRTSDESVYAVGDAVEVSHGIDGRKVLIPLAWPANRQGRIAADTMSGKRVRTYNGSLGTSILKVFDLTVASTGLNGKTLRTLGVSFKSVTVTRNSHAGYFPGTEAMNLKVLFGKDGRIFGAQGIGRQGVDKRIDLIAAAIKGNLKVQDLQDLEVAYAPPYNSAKDPVNIAGYAAENILEGIVKTVTYDQVEQYLKEDHVQALDVRTQEEHGDGAIPNSLNISHDELRHRLDELDRDVTYLVYCQVGHRGYLACRILEQNGFKAVNLDGGYALWQPASLQKTCWNVPEEHAQAYAQGL